MRSTGSRRTSLCADAGPIGSDPRLRTHASDARTFQEHRPREELAMGRRSGSADLPLHGGAVPKWLADRMTRLGAVMAEAIVHHLRPRRVAAPSRPSLLVPVLRRRDGHGLALVGHHHQRHRRAEARADAARRRTRRPRLRRARQAFAPDARGTGRDRRPRRLRRRGARQGEPARRQGRQRRGAGRLRSLSARLHRHRRRTLGGGAAGHERRAANRRAATTGCPRG